MEKELETQHLKTPLLCVRSWKLADYLQLESLKEAAIWALEDHLDAMVLLASSNADIEVVEPIWFGHFVDAFREVCAHSVMETLQGMFIAFLWVSRFKMLLPQTLEVLNKHPDVNNKLLKLLAWKQFEKKPPYWFPESLSHFGHKIEDDIHSAKAIVINDSQNCAKCLKAIAPSQGPKFYNPLPTRPRPTFGVGRKEIGQLVWCKLCVDDINEERTWPWQREGSAGSLFGVIHKTKVRAWAWSDDK